MINFKTLVTFGRRVLNPSLNAVNDLNKCIINNVPRRCFRRDLPDHPEDTVFKGEDFHGNKYYEAPSGSYLKTRRWMEPPTEMTEEEFEKLGWKEQMEVFSKRQDAAVLEVPPEWESWLRGRRPQIPSLQEQARSARVALKAKGLFPDQMETQSDVHSAGKSADEVRKDSVTGISFPVYEDMEVNPGEELTPVERRMRIVMSKVDEKAGDGDKEYVPPGAKKR